jgi:predicted alpha/beta-fold hydrolase
MARIPPFHERAPWIGADLQTIRNLLCGVQPDLPGGKRLLLAMPDGDRLAARLDLPAQSGARPLIVLIHGLTGSERSLAIIATMRYLVHEGWPVLRLNLRGTLLSQATSTGRYHAGKTEDLAAALHQLPPELLRQGAVLLGHSLGGNLVLKFMGEGCHGLPVVAAIVVSAPLDLAASCARMLSRRNLAYHAYLLCQAKREALAQGTALTSQECSAVAGARNFYEFDDRFIAPRFGYRDASDYYESNSAKNFLTTIARPTLILHALDDPWIPSESYAVIEWPSLPAIETMLSPRGGHLGFHACGSRIPWHDRVTGWWLNHRCSTSPD